MGPRALYGYRFGEAALPDVPVVRDDTKLIARRYLAPEVRRPVAVDLGVSVIDQVMPHPDMSHGPTVAAGLAKRVCARLPDPCTEWLEDARQFVQSFVKEHFEPLDPMTDLSRERWLELSNFPAWKKEELMAEPVFEPGCAPPEAYVFKSFVKDEFYPEYKHSRSIQAPADSLKAHLGPLVAACERYVFGTRPEFIKKVPVADRPEYISRVFGEGTRVAASDFSSFEVSWQRAQMEAFEMPILEHLLSKIPGSAGYLRDLRKCETGKIKLLFKHVTAKIVSTRKSGTVNTSFSNGVGNWLIHVYLGHKLGLGDLTGVFEGDDGLFRYSSGEFPLPEHYEKLGFSVKLEIHDSITTASFCGMIFDPQEKVAVWDPVAFITKLGWGSARYLRARRHTKLALLRCKALSLAAQCPGAPVLAECAAWILRCTEGVNVKCILESRNTGWWERQSYLRGSTEPFTKRAGPATRELVWRKFGLSVSTQEQMELWFRSQNQLCQIPSFWDNPLWSENNEKYVRVLTHHSLDTLPIFPDCPFGYPVINYQNGEAAIVVVN